ncbi:alpha-amylase [Treponema vincentii]|uniref:alpha-amylase family glycosyl hydrolase n=1 Tax=Treponema vincentii TaxID=69710 RepID=UPI0020A27649|nr:alpha-amylase family glycosyl hydrolase [Treponema vincentii]UTC59542.1 alpha-amylase [Treponema vincentii]
MQKVYCNSFFQKMEFHINRDIREKCRFSKTLFSSTGNVVIRNINDIYAFTFQYNQVVESGVFGMPVRAEQYLKAGQLNAMGLIDEIFHYMCRLYRRDVRADFFSSGYAFVQAELAKEKLPNLDELLLAFCTEFPPAEVYGGTMTVEDWLRNADPVSGIENKYRAFEELILCKLANENPAFQPFYPLFTDEQLAAHPSYNCFWDSLREWSSQNEVFGPEKMDLISLLKAPVSFAPFSLKGQLEYIKMHWLDLLSEFISRLLTSQDILSEEEKAAWQGGGGGGYDAYHFEDLTQEYERFSADREWMPNVVMIAKSTLVWLDQLSKKYQRSITRLDQIPDEELNFLAEAGFNALWLIGVWERSPASARIKQICGNPEAAASAYSLMDYEIAGEIGGWGALEDLRRRAGARGIRLAADMVPNHTGIDSKWVMERPDLFMQTRESPFPGYNFDGENLSHDSRVGIYLENHYYSKTDCAVVFKRVDHYTGDVRYIYHGNDGTGLPWNDTAQIDFLNSEAREEVIRKILHVARNFPIIRFDAAMVLAKKHIRRLWYPEPGRGGDIASRSRFALSTEEFQKRIPEEFWREVVDRCAAEAPDTLLLAEAFWMMEGYFVRTLGMHRVYNSAFMNMLKREDNAQYRLTIKNTLEFDPQILKRYVNFMNNPDEETAVAQFGRDDKYFGVCTMLVAMPGLPMFGHGQIEGFEEKYGMEYRRAYYDEQVNTGLVERHRREIFPLMRLRRLFSEVEHFLLYDFWTDGQVNENVFAWSNVYGDARSLILYNNKYERAAGWINMSAAYAVKGADDEKRLVQRTLAQGLQLTVTSDRYVIFQEQHSKLWFIRKNSEIAEHGLFAALNGFETQVFLNIYEVTDTPDEQYRKLYEKLNGSGIADVAMGINEIKFKKLYDALEACVSKELIQDCIQLIKDCKHTENRHETEAKIQSFIRKTEPLADAFLTALDETYRSNQAEQFMEEKVPAVKTSVQRLLTLYKARMYRLLLCASGLLVQEMPLTAMTPAVTVFIHKMCGTNSQLAVSFGSVFLMAVEDIAVYYKMEDNIGRLFAFLHLEEKLVTLIRSAGFEIDSIENKADTVKYLYYVHTARGKKTIRRTGIVHRLTQDPNVIARLGIHEWDGTYWFNREAAELISDDMAAMLFLSAARPVTPAECIKKTTASVEKYCRFDAEFSSAIHRSGYQVDRYLKLFAGTLK